ncbi:MAG: tRNA pseudouridine(55) synthase TruB [Clostridiales bacterium]|nr:tRNA pseudouridine(55) synthase TruB [Clostridiales bacterium]
MKDGILIIDKPQNWTSHDCVAVCRRAVGNMKTGHGGTLDPMAEGMLPVFIGKATRIMEYLDLDYKTYRCSARLGVETDTQDIWGEVTALHETANITRDDIIYALDFFAGDISQTPPKYSAIKHKGKKLYEYARAGKEVEIAPRQVHIRRIDIISMDMESKEVTFDIECSKGTYVRTICSDLGDRLGCGGTLCALKRMSSGIFDLSGALSPEELKTMSEFEIEKMLIPTDRPLVHFGIIEMSRDRARYFARGNSIRYGQFKVPVAPAYSGDVKNKRGISYSNIYKVYERDTQLHGENERRFLGTGYLDEDNRLLKADKIFAAERVNENI